MLSLLKKQAMMVIVFNLYLKKNYIFLCSVSVTEKCPSLSAPRYGALSCDIWVGGRYCQMQCQGGYDVPRFFPGLSVCSDDGDWFPKDNIKDCRSNF